MVLNDKQLYTVYIRFNDKVKGDVPSKSYSLQVLAGSVESAFAVGLKEFNRIVKAKNKHMTIISVDVAIANELIYADGDL